MKDVERLAASFSSAIYDLRSEISEVFGELSPYLTQTEQQELDSALGHFRRNADGSDDSARGSRFTPDIRFSPELRLMETFTANMVKAMVRENKNDIAGTYERRDTLFGMIPDHLAREDVKKALEDNGAPTLAQIVADHPAYTLGKPDNAFVRKIHDRKPTGPGGPKR